MMILKRIIAFVFPKWLEATLYYNVGFSGQGKSLIDESLIKDHKLKPPNKFTLWLYKDDIEREKKRHQNAFRQACIEVLGEDPETDWCDF